VPVGACAVVLALAYDAGASASSRLVYARADSAARCPDEQGLRAAVASRLGYDPFFPWAQQTISIDVTESSGKLLARLKLVDRDGIARGERELTAPMEDCAELIASLSIAIVADGTQVFWTNLPGGTNSYNAELMKCSVEGCVSGAKTVEPDVLLWGWATNTLAVDDRFVYWVTMTENDMYGAFPNAAVHRAPK
jgi:hypothetical protein